MDQDRRIRPAGSQQSPRTFLEARVGVRELTRRQRQLRLSLGQQIRELRLESGVTLTALARAAGIDPGFLSRIEAGVAHPSLEILIAIAACLGADFSARLFPGSGPRLHDRFQAPIVDALIRGLHPRWVPLPELAVPRARGVIDLVLSDRGGAITIACECHSEVRDLERVIRRSNEKAAALLELGRHGADVSTLLILRSTMATRSVARVYESTLRSAYPARSADALAALFGNRDWPGAAIVWARVEGGRAVILDRPPRGVRLGR
jgi:transcriptional regulator with XRE-family HTH domain